MRAEFAREPAAQERLLEAERAVVQAQRVAVEHGAHELAISFPDNRAGAVFRVNEFYKQIAVGSGIGMRFDFTFFLFRLDLGMKMRDPSLAAGKRFIPGNYRFNSDQLNLSFAIGYPF